jgi:hypothetical protein
MPNLVNGLFCGTFSEEIPIRWLSIIFWFESRQRYYGGSFRALSFSENEIEAWDVEVYFGYS